MATSAWMHGAAAMRLTEGLVSVLKEQRPEYLSEVLTNYREHGVFPTQGASDVAGLVGFCNAKLSSSKTRLEGLCLLSMLVKDSSSDLFQQHCLSWLRSLQQVIQSQAPCQSIQLAVSILQDLLQYSCQLAELAREVGLNSILGILMSLLGLKTECERAAMEGMRACMVYYPRACGSLKDKLGAYFLSKMDSTSRKTQEMACQGYSLLPCLGGLADRSAGTGRAEGWTNQIQCLLASANGILAQIYQGSETDEAVQYRGPGVELPFPHLDQTDPLLLLQLQHRYTAVCLVLKHTLRADPASAVHLPVRPILNLVCRALAVNSRNTSLTADGSLRLLVLPSVHISTLEVLAELITVVRSGMVQYAAVLQKLFSQMLCAWTAVPEANVGQQRAYSSVRVSVYRTLELWLQLVGASANVLQGASSHAELLFTHLLADITPGAESIKLRAGLSADVVPGGKPGPRRTKQLVMADPVGASLQRKGDPVSNQDTCLSALKVLRRIIQTSGTLLKNDIHKRLHEVVLPLCVRLQQQQTSSITACESVGGVSGQYSSALTRRQLYRLLLALVLVPSPCWPPPLTCTVSILSNGRLDRNLKVSSFCSEALTICNSLLHPRVPSIALPLPPLALKPPPTASVLSGPGPAPRLTLPTLLGGPAPGPPFPGRHPLSLGPNSLLGSLENHLSLVPGMPGPASAPGDLLLSPHGQPQPDPAGLGLPDGQRPVFVRYDKEEAEDVEISLASDSDDSVVIVPPGMLGAGSQLDDPAPGSQNLLSAGAGAGVPLPGGDTVAMVPSTAAPASLDVTSLPNDLVPTSSTPANSFPSSSGSVVSLVTSLTPGSAPPPAGGLADPVAVKPQLQQMLLQPPAQGPQGPPGSVALPLQVQLQNQLAQQGRHLHQHPPQAPPSNQDSAVININSTDDEDEDEDDMEDDEELEEEEEEDGLDEEEEGSEDFYEGEEYEDFDDEEAEELEEEEEDEDGDMPPLEGSEDKSEEVTMEEEEEEEEEEEKALGAEEEEGEGAGFNPEGGIEELQSSRALFGEERMKVQEVESIGVLEEARGGDRGDGEDDSERMDDPSMPQILCVTGGALEERADSSQEAAQAAGELQDQLTLWDQNHQQNLPTGASEEEPTAHSQEESVAEREQEAGVREEVALEAELQEEEEPVVVQEEAAAGASGGEETPAAPHDPQQDQTDTQQGYETQAEWTKPVGEQGEKEEESNTEEEEKGMKRKREEEGIEDEARPSPEKKKQDDEAMASMLADFIACPPDDEDVASGSNQS